MQNEQQIYIGLSIESGYYRACAVQIQGAAISVLKNYSRAQDEADWRSFVETIRQDYPNQPLVTSLAFNDSCVGFYNFEIPVVNEKQMPLVIASQAEVHLPLPIEQMQVDWRIVSETAGKARVAVAAAKRTMLVDVAGCARQCNADAVVLQSEAFLRAAGFLCDTLKKDFALLRMSEGQAKLLFVQGNMLVKVATFDGIFLTQTTDSSAEMSLLCLDIQNVLAEYTSRGEKSLPLFLEGETAAVDDIAACLEDKGIAVSRIQYDTSGVIVDDTQTDTDIVCLGAVLSVSETATTYDLFKGLHQKSEPDKKVNPKRTNRILAAVVCVMFVVFIAVSYGVDRFRLAAYQKQMDRPEFRELLEMHRFRIEVAQQRIDIPELITKINETTPQGVTVHSVSFSRFQKISVGASCKDPKLMYHFMDALAKSKGVGTVRVSNPDFDEKKKETVFTLTFDYKYFTDKRKTFR